MPTVSFVAAIGRVSLGADSARPKIESIVAKHGGKVTGGVGSSQDPIVAEFTEKKGAVEAAQEAWYLDDVESAKVMNADGPGLRESADAPVTIASIDDAIDAVTEGAAVADVVTSLVEKKSMPPWLKKKGDKKDDDKKGDDKKDDKGDKKKDGKCDDDKGDKKK